MSAEVTILHDHGHTISRTRGLRALRHYGSVHQTSKIEVTKGDNGSGLMVVKFQNGSVAFATFPAFNTLCQCLRRWRSLYNTVLFVCAGSRDIAAGRVSYENDFLKNPDHTLDIRQKVLV